MRAAAERFYPSHPSHPAHPTHPAHARPSTDYLPSHARLSLPAKPDKPPHPSLPKGEPNFSPYNYPYRSYDKPKEPHLPAPPPLVPEKNSVIVKHDAKQIHLEQKHPYSDVRSAAKPRAEPPQHYLPSRNYRPPAPHAPHAPHAPIPQPAQDKTRRLYQPQPQRSPHYYQSATAPAPPVKPKVSSPAPQHIYGKPSNSPTPPQHYVPEPALLDPLPVPYPPPSPYSPAHTRPPPPAHSRTPEPRAPPPRVDPSPCQTQPLDLGVARDDPERNSPRRRIAPVDPEVDAKRRRLEEPPPPEPLIAAALAPGRAPHGSEPAPPAPGPPCDVRVPSADGSIETPERAAGASPAPHRTPTASPAPNTPVPPPATPTPPAPPVTPPSVDTDTTSKATGSPVPVRHLGKKAWLQRHETAPVPEGDCSGGGGTCITLPMAISRASEPDDSPGASNIVVPVAAKSIQRGTRKPGKPRKIKEPNGRTEDAEEDSSSSDHDVTPPKRKPPKAKRKKGTVPRKAADETKRKKASESGSESDKESDDKDSDSGASGSGSGSASGRRGTGRARGGRRQGRGGRGGRRRDEPPKRGNPALSLKAAPTDSFLQSGPCFEVAPRLAKCRECRWSPAQRDKDMPNIFCRFYAFRRLKYAKNRQLAIAGFSDPYKDADEVIIALYYIFFFLLRQQTHSQFTDLSFSSCL